MRKSLESLRQRLKRVLDQGQISKVELARKSSLDRSGLDKYLKGITSPTLDALDKIANALETTSWQLIQPDEDRSLIETLIPLEILQKLSKLAPEKRQKILDTMSSMLELAGAENGDPKKKASGL